MLVSFIISTHNRREVLLNTIGRLDDLGLADFEIHVVDNASTDGTVDAIRALGHVHLYPQKVNSGSCAKNIAIPHSAGEFIIFLDDDSYPQPGAVERMIAHFRQRPRLGAATFTITLPDGSRECSAFPNVFIGCGVGLRREAIEEVGGLPDDFFMQAEEYDLSLRLLDAGWDVEAFDDLHVTHLKSPMARASERTMRLDVRNNIMLIGTYFPDEWAMPFCVDWLRRYWMIASAKGQRRAFLAGMIQGCVGVLRRKRMPVSEDTFEQFAKIGLIYDEMRRARDLYGARSVMLIDLGKNVLPYWMAAKAWGLRIAGIAENRLAGRRYRGIQILNDEEARGRAFDMAVVSNSSPVHARARAMQWRAMDGRPVIDLLAMEASGSMSAAA